MYACTLDSDSDTTLDEDDSPRSQDDSKDEATADPRHWSWVEGDNQPQPQPETVIERPETLIEDNDDSSESDGIIEIAPSGYSEGAAAAATPETGNRARPSSSGSSATADDETAAHAEQLWRAQESKCILLG